MQSMRKRQRVILASVFAATLTWSSGASAEDHVRGVVTARGNDGTVAMRTDDSSNLTVVLTDLTKIRRTSGLRELKVSSAELILGLRIHVEGEYEGGNRIVAERVS